MGFNHCYLTSVKDLERHLENVGLEKFIKMYRSYDAVSGPSECFIFIEKKIKLWDIIVSGGGHKEDQASL
jgi:hypothetical protein